MRIEQRQKLLFWLATGLLLTLGATQLLSTASPQPTAPPLVINEVVASNGTGLTDEDGDFSDWIELYNPTSQPVNLSGWSLSDDPRQPQKWLFPDVTLPSQGYLLIFASGKNRPDPLHTNFKLGKEGEYLGLFNILTAEVVDALSPRYPVQRRNIAYGRRGPAGRFAYLSPPSPGQPNTSQATQTWLGLTAPVVFTPTRGFYDEPTTITLQTETPGAEIRYTTDGSEPSAENGHLYTGPLTIERTTLLRAVALKPDHLPAPSATHTYIFLENVLRQPPDPPGWPAFWGQYEEYYPGLPPKGAPVEADYAIDPRIIQAHPDRDALQASFKTIPSLSLVTAPQNFDIYANAVERGPAWERPISVELITPNDPAGGFQINAGVRMQGVSARWSFMPKKSFRLFFKGQYGATKLKYPLFPDSPVDEFDTLVLRGGANRSYAGYIDAVDYTQVTYTRDEWARASQIEMSGLGSHGIFVHLYLNGLYWGLYNVVERPDASFAAAYLGGEKEDWFAVKHGGTLLNPEAVAEGAEPQIKIGEEISGSNHRYEALLALLEQGNLADPQNYAALRPYLDTAHFSDYIMLNLYAGNHDWGDNNWYAAVRNQPPGPLRYFEWDAEITWNDGASLYLGKTTPHHKIRPLFLALMENPDFRLEFADRMYKNLFNDGPLTDANAQARWLRLTKPLKEAIIGESARWGDVRYRDNPIDQEDWLQARANVLTQMEGNAAKLVALARQAGYYPHLDPPRFVQRGGPVPPGFAVTLNPPAAPSQVYYTTDDRDPRRPVSGEIGPTARPYQGPVVLTATTLFKARTWADGEWSALNEALFEIESSQGRLEITEIMYHPSGGDAYEFIELQNRGQRAIPLANAVFEGIDFAFPPGIDPLPPGERLVLARDPAAFAARYPGIKPDGVYQGQLSNQGEAVTLTGAEGEILLRVVYDDERGWPVSPDGRGDSLVRIDLSGDPNDPKNWRASAVRHGSPGRGEATGLP